MTIAVRLLSVVLMGALIGPGVLLPLVARAQSQMPSSAEPSAAPPAPPDLYQEALRANQPSPNQYQGAYVFGAVVTSLFAFPGRFLLCAGGGIPLSLVTLLVTFGSGYGAAKSVFEEGCVGKWVVTPNDLRAANRGGMGVYSP